jgi:hypothetical protein
MSIRIGFRMRREPNKGLQKLWTVHKVWILRLPKVVQYHTPPKLEDNSETRNETPLRTNLSDKTNLVPFDFNCTVFILNSHFVPSFNETKAPSLGYFMDNSGWIDFPVTCSIHSVTYYVAQLPFLHKIPLTFFVWWILCIYVWILR